MMAIVGLQVAPLSAILDKSGAVTNGGMGDTAAAIDKNSSADPALYLDRISTIFRYYSILQSFPSHHAERFFGLFLGSSLALLG